MQIKDFLLIFYFIFAGISIIIIPVAFGQPFQQHIPSMDMSKTALNLNNSTFGKENSQTANGYSFINKWGSQGNGNGQFAPPRQIAVDSSGNVYVADAGNDRVQKFDSNGNFLTKWGSQGSDNGQFLWPEGIAVDSSDNVYVAD